MRQVTGSKLPILQHCQYWAREDVVYTTPESGAAAGRGTGIHGGIDTGSLAGVAFDDIAIVQKGIAYLNELRAAGWTVETEVALALNYVTGGGRPLKSSGHRDYTDLKPNEIGLTVDYVATHTNPEGHEYAVEVGDWKTGYGSHVDRASENWQLGAAAAVLSDMWGDLAVNVKIHYLDNDWTDSWTFSAMDAQRFGVFIRNRVELVPTAQPSPGEHCRYCPARVQCPKTQTAMVALGDSRVQWGLDFVSAENEAAMAMNLPMLESAVKAVKEALQARNPGGIPLPNGKVYKPIPSGRSGMNHKAMAERLMELGEDVTKYKTRTEYEQWRQVKP